MGKGKCTQALQKQITFMGVFRQKIVIIVLPEFQPRNHRFLQRGRRTDGEKIMDFFDAIGNFRWRDGISQPPAGDGIGFR
ncbi:hypothetical protein SDC9_127780 [bioreactor metagenome]|uniref:Uncharacterized protein n=1 Tax=bioreactor metagenome TaxID=1076179 RepID=A0A645CUD1_9ZZZZ